MGGGGRPPSAVVGTGVIPGDEAGERPARIWRTPGETGKRSRGGGSVGEGWFYSPQADQWRRTPRAARIYIATASDRFSWPF